MIDYHLHTLFCNHAVGGMEQYIQSAIDLGLREVCFLDHLTIQETGTGLSMTPEEIPYYFQAVQVLKQKYRDKISVKVGLEIDFNPAYIDFFQDIIRPFAFDVIATSLHFPGGLDIVTHHSEWRYGKKDVDGDDQKGQGIHKAATDQIDQDNQSHDGHGRHVKAHDPFGQGKGQPCDGDELVEDHGTQNDDQDHRGGSGG